MYADLNPGGLNLTMGVEAKSAVEECATGVTGKEDETFRRIATKDR